MATLTDVSRQYSTRPEDETFESLQAAYDASLAHYRATVEREVIPSTLRIDVVDGDVRLVGKGDVPAKLTHWSFGQLSGLVGAPASYLRDLPPTLVAQNLNFGLKERYGTKDAPVDKDEKVNLLLHHNGNFTVRSVNSDVYSRIWNHELLKRLIDLGAFGWHNPAPFNKGDQVGTVWVSDHDMFVFQVNDENLISAGKDASGVERFLRRGFIMSNSEVGGGAWKTKTFLFDYMCCNRMIWGAEEISEISIRHVHSAADKVDELMARFHVGLTKYVNASAQTDELKIASAKSTVIADTKDNVIEKVFSVLRGQASRRLLEASYDTAESNPDTDALPNTVWGFANGMTRYSQSIPFADERMKIDTAAGKLVEIAAQAF